MKKKEMIPLSEEENKSYEGQDVSHICKKKFYLDKNNENESNENECNENESDKNENKNETDKMKSTEKLKIIVITPGNLEELLIAIAI